MEDQKIETNKNEGACCSHACKDSKCACGKCKGIRILIKIVIILVIFSAGVGVGSRMSGRDGNRHSYNNFRGGMMRGARGNNWQNPTATPDNSNTPTASTAATSTK